MKARTFVAIFILMFSLGAWSQASLIPIANSYTNDVLWAKLMAINAAGETEFGKCKVLDARNCASCACDYYFRANVVGSLNMYGWPKNPSSGDSTGCISTTQWGGYTPAMATSNFPANGRAMLLDALNKNACGTPVPPINTGGVSVLDNSQLFFVNPSATCAGGEIICGTTGLGSSVGTMVQFNLLPKSFCKAAYGAAMKAKGNKAKFITCQQRLAQSLSTQAIAGAASMVGQLNAAYSVFEMLGLQKYLDYTVAQLNTMTFDEIALYYVAVGELKDKMPDALKDNVKPSKFGEARAGGDKHIVQSEIDAAKTVLATLKQGEVPGRSFTLEQALAYMQSQTPAQ
ncbi:MAG: hypothetical protein H0V66_00335 [Bdellovibrionales bacterium]|nr:hypothetical protein [Bdellovibrionales bacterium]